MKLIDRIGLAANNMDKRLLALIKDIEVMDFDEISTTATDLSQTLVVGQDLSLPIIFRFVNEHRMNYLVQKKHEYFFYNLVMAAMISKYPEVFLKSPITLMTRNEQSKEQTLIVPFNSTKDKERIMFECESFISQNNSNSTILQNLKLIINEMFSNAMYSAPTDDNGNYLYAAVPRNVEVTYPKDVVGEFLLSFNKDIFAVACRDPYGSVNKLRVTRRLHQVFHGSKLASVEHRNNDNLGSGLGLKMIIENSLGFGMVVKEGQKTLVYATLPLGSGNRKVSRIAKNICFKFF